MRRIVLAAGLLPLVLLAGACTGHDGGRGVATVDGSGAPGATPSLSVLEQGIRYAQCMRAHGVPLEDPVANGDGVHFPSVDKDAVDGDTLARAEEACKSLRPVLSGPDLDRKLALARGYSICMRAHGVEDYPDPDEIGRIHLDPSINQDPDYDRAKAACDAEARSPRPTS